jgi:chemotaxis protein methyltransferase CheR
VRPTDTNPASLSLGVFLLLRDLISERLGVWFEEDKRDLFAAKLSDRVADLGLRSFLDYFYHLKYGTEAEAEWPRLTNALSVQETYFWREFDQIRTLVDVLVPQHVAENRGPVRVWSAACATGEEPLTIAMALNEAGWFQRADVEVWASDASPAALHKAAVGVYRERSFRTLPDSLRAKYFTATEDGWLIHPSIHARVRYTTANLLEPTQSTLLSRASFIFCRNVFIYFSASTIARVAASFSDRMPRPGYLFVGASESLLRVKTDFALEQIGNAFVYVVQ